MEGAASPIQVEATGATLDGTFEMLGVQHVEINGLELNGLWNIRTSDTNQNLPTTKISHDLLFSGFSGKTVLMRNLQNTVFRELSFGDGTRRLPRSAPEDRGLPAEGGAPERLSSASCSRLPVPRRIRDHRHRPRRGFYFDAGVDGLAMRRCTFTNCAVFDIFSNGQMAGRPIKNVLIESCMSTLPRDQTGGVPPPRST